MQLIDRSPADSFNNAGFGLMAVFGRGDFFVWLRWCAEPELTNVDKIHMGCGEPVLYLTVYVKGLQPRAVFKIWMVE